MRNRTYLLWSLLLGLLFMTYACSDDTPGGGSGGSSVMSVDWPEGEDVPLEAQMGAVQELDFHADQNWTTSVSQDWLEVEPSSGGAGDYTLKLSVIKPNDTGDVRTATLSLISGSTPLRITIIQEEYIRVEKETYNVPAEGGNLDINFFTTIDQGTPDNPNFNVYSSGADWITDRQAAATRADEDTYNVQLRVLPNEGKQSRSTMFYFVKEPFDNAHANNYILATATIVQAGQGSGTSESYEEDGKVVVLQEHTAGEGIPLVMMGDGFLDTEITSGYYQQVMDKAVEHLFSEHPISEMAEYFDIYCVKVVSPNGNFGVGEENYGETALGCWMETGTSTGVGGNDETVQQYAQKVEGIDLDDTQVVVILNSDAYKGTNYNYWYTDGTPSNFSIAYFPIIGNLESEDFHRVLVHETVGHGIGKLHDEYSYKENPLMPDDEIAQTQQQQEDFGWWLNVDFTDDEQAVLWSPFLFDPRYDDQGLGIFEGACTYMSGAYRSTEESMMNGNTMGFNAPSRRALYNNIIKRGEGRTPTLEEFIDFDQQTYVKPTQTRAAAPSRPFGRPRTVRLDRPLGR